MRIASTRKDGSPCCAPHIHIHAQHNANTHTHRPATMQSALLALGLGSAVINALVIRWCEFDMTASGSISGNVGTISSGQVRAGSGVESTEFEISDGKLYTSEGYGCAWTRTSEPSPSCRRKRERMSGRS